MTLSDRDVKRGYKRFGNQFEPTHDDKWGEIVEVAGSTFPPGRENQTWVDMFKMGHSVLAVWNDTTLKKAGTAVQIGNDPKPPGLRVTGLYTKALPPNSTVNLPRFNTPPHAPNHQYLSETLIGDDPVLVYQPALQMLKTTGNGMNLIVSTQAYGPFPGADTDMTADIPATAGHVRRVLIYYDRAQNKMATIQGAAVLDNGVMPIPYPETPENATESAYIRLANGQTSISTVNHVEDARDFLASGSDLALDDLIDVTLTTPADGEVLTYDEENNIWVNLPSGAGVSDVDDLTTDTGNSGEMVRVAAAGGLEYRTPTQVLTDIGALAITNNLSDVDNAPTARENLSALGYIEGSVHNGIARWWGTEGDILNYSSVIIDDSDNMTIPGTLSNVLSTNATFLTTIRNENTGTSARAGYIAFNGAGGGDSLGLILSGENYSGVSGWGDRGILSTGSGISGGLLLYATAGGIQLSTSGTNVQDLFVAATGQVTIPNINVTGGAISGITDLAVADGGTGASNEGGARTNLGLVAGGAGDIWVEKAGDTMTGALIINAASPQLELQGASQQLNFGTTGANGHINGASSALTIHGSAGIEFTANSGDYFWTISTTQLMQGTTTEVTFNPNGESTLDFRVAGENNANMIVVDSSTDRVGIGKSPTQGVLDVAGAAFFEQDVNGDFFPSVKNESTGTSARVGLRLANGAYVGNSYVIMVTGQNYSGVSGWADRVVFSGDSGIANGVLIRAAAGGIQLTTTGTDVKDLFVDASGRVGIGGSPNASAKLDVQSTTGALLVPRMTTTQRDALTAVNGMIIYNSTTNTMQGRVNGAWANL